ncbi:hypothetical protein EIN_186500 [Entamoeba invadens IP1]|uniref:hypothetical protein n=1 Tax=Entamoeba invadens IP1 TaxID=370355 RepID=UPI0002C3CEB5|nr:hypothetical protein EIN_186500 [Entamoeba invadens IP1]ELP94223.1 hypothetical protein EIN_186500 [Entamoeba invadens IP1]|eukprot:XP_004260994.1 hypothetical protein EIN_186500 [Entamoeba invadens IP1]
MSKIDLNRQHPPASLNFAQLLQKQTTTPKTTPKPRPKLPKRAQPPIPPLVTKNKEYSPKSFMKQDPLSPITRNAEMLPPVPPKRKGPEKTNQNTDEKSENEKKIDEEKERLRKENELLKQQLLLEKQKEEERIENENKEKLRKENERLKVELETQKQKEKERLLAEQNQKIEEEKKRREEEEMIERVKQAKLKQKAEEEEQAKRNKEDKKKTRHRFTSDSKSSSGESSASKKQKKSSDKSGSEKSKKIKNVQPKMSMSMSKLERREKSGILSVGSSKIVNITTPTIVTPIKSPLDYMTTPKLKKEIAVPIFLNNLKEKLNKGSELISSVKSVLHNQAIHTLIHRNRAVEGVCKYIKNGGKNEGMLTTCLVEVGDGYQSYCVMCEESLNYFSRSMLAIVDDMKNDSEERDKLFSAVKDTLITNEEITFWETYLVDCESNTTGIEMLKKIKQRGEEKVQKSIEKIKQLARMEQQIGDWESGEKYGVFAFGRNIQEENTIEVYDGENWGEGVILYCNDIIVIKNKQEILFVEEYENFKIENVFENVWSVSKEGRGVCYIKTDHIEEFTQKVNTKRVSGENFYQFPIEL